jgi:CIC family chloride channel protein
MPSTGLSWLEELKWHHLVRRFVSRPPEQVVLLLTALVVGVTTGFGAVLFRWLIVKVTNISFEWLPQATQGMGPAYLVIAPTVGGLLVGVLVHNFAPEAKGHGVPEVMEAVALRGGRIRPVVAVVKSLASSICIGTGGSVGREGPIVQIGSALGSSLGQLLQLSRARLRNLVACGAAAGIAATFNAPIAGAVFALEVILGSFAVPAFGTVVISSVTASVVGRWAFGDVPAFVVPEYSIESLWEFPIYLALGVAAAIAATIYTRSIYSMEDLWERWNIRPWIKPAVGGLLLGIMALFYGRIPILSFDVVPQVYGVGYSTIDGALNGTLLLPAMLFLLALKICATSLTLGSGGSGGVFAPSLFVGALLGGCVGLAAEMLFPGLPGPPGAYALVGMGAVFAGATHAVMTAVIIMFEMTGDYKIILPLMLSVVTATLLTRWTMYGESIYTLKLTRRGVRLQQGRDVDVLQRVRVEDVMTRLLVNLRPDDSLEEATRVFLSTNRVALTVLDEEERLIGIVSLSDLRHSAEDEGTEEKRVGDIMTRSLITAYPDETLDLILRRMGPGDLSRLPVVLREDPTRLVGVLRRNDLVRAYNLARTQEELDS